MSHKYSKWPKIETVKAIKKEDSDRSCEIFNTGEWKSFNKSGFFEIRFFNPEDIIFQHLS